MSQKTRKATLLGVATALIPWAIQQALAARYYRAAVAFSMGFGALYAYEELNLRQIPTSADDLHGLSATVGDAVQERVDDTTDD